MTGGFGARLAQEFAGGRHLCVGIDPHAELLDSWGLEPSAAGAERFARDVLEAAAGVAACIKPQISFFERFGAAGYVALERVLAEARAAGVLVIADAKRGDIGSTLDAYAEAWLAAGSPLEVDALTVTPYLGFGSLRPAVERTMSDGKGLFVLAATSNPEARTVQTARRADGQTVAAAMLADVRAANAERAISEKTLSTESAASAPEVGSMGVVLGATLRLSDFGIDIDAQHEGPLLPVLAPGFGHQGARIEDAHTIFGTYRHGMLANESRSILVGGSTGLAQRIADRSAAIAGVLHSGDVSE